MGGGVGGSFPSYIQSEERKRLEGEGEKERKREGGRERLYTILYEIPVNVAFLQESL